MTEFAYILIGIEISLITISSIWFYHEWKKMRQKTFSTYIGDLQSFAADLKAMNLIEEHGELYFRDKEGNLCHTKIVVDHSIPSTASMLPNLKDGEETIVFSPRAAQDLMARGIPLDAILTTLLRDRGRIN